MLSAEIDITPVEAFKRLRGLKYPFLISTWEAARVVAVGAEPFAIVKAEADGRVSAEGLSIEPVSGPFEALSSALIRFAFKGGCQFGPGAVGYFSYDLKSAVEPRLEGKAKRGGLGLPLMMAGLYDPVFVFDERRDKGTLVSVLGDGTRFSRFREILSKPANSPAPVGPARRFSSNMDEGRYKGLIKRAKEYIEAGDIYQINLSQRLNIDWQGDPFSLFAKLFESHQAPFASFLDYGGFQIISNSPERLVRVKNGVAETSPIKGTRPRGGDARADKALIDELKKSVKERAEHVMIVDLERNDLGRICVPGSVEVSAFEAIETFPHLHHLVSTVRGKVKDGVDGPAALKALFPGGSVTGAPKVRAMEIIEELEPTPREVYTGGIGWMGFNGDIDLSMAIRTAVYKDNTLYLNVGGGIVADSDPEDEYRETLLKARDFLGALGLENGGLK